MRRESNFILTWNLQKFEKSFQISPLLDRSCQSIFRPVWHSSEPTSLLSVSEGFSFRACSYQCRRHRPFPAVEFLTLECLAGNSSEGLASPRSPFFLIPVTLQSYLPIFEAFPLATSVLKSRSLNWAQCCGADLSSFEKKKAVTPLTLIKLC